MPNKTIDALTWRYATKKFDPSKKLTPEQENIVLEAIRMAPTSFGLQNFRVVVVKKPEMKLKLREVAYGQPQVTDSAMYLVFCVQKNITEDDIQNHVELVGKTRGVEMASLDGYKQMLLGFINNKTPDELSSWAARQAYITLGFGLMAAALNDIDACPMEGFDNSKFDELLALHDRGLKSVCAMAVGFRAADDAAAKTVKVRLPSDKLFIRA